MERAAGAAQSPTGPALPPPATGPLTLPAGLEEYLAKLGQKLQDRFARVGPAGHPISPKDGCPSSQAASDRATGVHKREKPQQSNMDHRGLFSTGQGEPQRRLFH